MNQRLLSVLIFAFVVSAGASLLLYRLIASRVTANAKQPTTQIIVAARNLDLGILIREADLRASDWSGPLPRGSLLRKEDVVGRGVMAAIYEGEPILENRLAAKGAGAGLAATIPAGMRAVAVRVNEVVGVAGFVVPGMRVDVLISGTPPATQGGAPATTVSRTLLQNIEVLSAGQNFQKDTEGKPVQVQVVNLLVTPEQAEVLSLASNETRIQLVLRNPLDTVTAKTTGSSMASLYGTAKPPEPPAPRPRPAGPRVKLAQPVVMTPFRPAAPVAVEVINGNKRVESKFPSGEGIQ